MLIYKRLRYYFRYSKAFLSKHYLPVFFGVIFSLLAILIIPKIISAFPQLRSTRHIAIIGRYSITDLPLSVQSKISIGLTVIGSGNLPGPGMAQSWDVTDEGKTVTFNLNTSLTWQDGSTVKSQDIMYSFRGADIQYPNSEQIVFKLQDPYSPLVSLVSRPVFKQKSSRLGQQIIGTGSYRISSYKQTGGVIDTLVLTPVSIENKLPLLVYHFYTSAQQARNAYKLGTINEILDLPEPSDLSSWPNADVAIKVQEDRYVALFFNTQDPFLSGTSGRNLRLSLAYAIDKSKYYSRAISPIAPSSWAYNPEVKKYDYDVTRAKSLIKNVEKVPESLTIRTLPAYIEIAENIKADWEILGIKVEIISETEFPMDFQIALVAQALPIDPDQYIYWHSTEEVTNITKLKNDRIDLLLEEGRKSWDQENRKKIYADFQRFLVEEAPAVFLYHPITYTVVKK